MSSSSPSNPELPVAASGPRIAVIVPCHNEALTIGTVVKDFQRVLPSAEVYVFDNLSTDATSAEALAAGAQVKVATRPGKGSVVRKMFSEVEADVYLMVDGDGTYEPEAAPVMVDLLVANSLDMVVGTRQPADDVGEEYRSGHVAGNRLFSWLYRSMFRMQVDDAFSGYRAMSRRFVKSFPATTSGFDIETELLAHAAELKLEVAEVPARYFARPEGSESKLGTYSDGIKILWSAVRLYRDLAPRAFFGMGAFLSFVLAAVLGIPILNVYIETGLVPRLPTAIASMVLLVVSLLLVTSGLVISAIRQVSREQRRLAYLTVPPVPEPDPRTR